MTILYKQHFRVGMGRGGGEGGRWVLSLASGKAGARDGVQQKISGPACFDPEL